MSSSNSSEHRIIGLDIGIASVGWAVISPSRIVNLGVRAFDKAETDKEGESLNLQRRSARLMRHRLFNRQWRLTKLARFLKKKGLIDQVKFFKNQPAFKESSWQLRAEGLNRLLTPQEWSRVIYHVCKHRGFHWISKAERAKSENDAEGEGGIRQRLQAYVANGGKFTNGESKAFPADQPLRKPDRQGNLSGPVVRSVKLQINKLTGISGVREGATTRQWPRRIQRPCHCHAKAFFAVQKSRLSA